MGLGESLWTARVDLAVKVLAEGVARLVGSALAGPAPQCTCECPKHYCNPEVKLTCPSGDTDVRGLAVVIWCIGVLSGGLAVAGYGLLQRVIVKAARLARAQRIGREDGTSSSDGWRDPGVAGAAKAAGAMLDAVAAGELTPTEGAHIMSLVETYRRTLETSELEARVTALEGGAA